MSRVHAVAPMANSSAPYRGPSPSARTARSVEARRDRTESDDYIERAMLLWPRLDRARLRRVAADPARMAGLIERRTSQPYDAILAMLTRQTDRLAESADGTFDSARVEVTRLTLHVVRADSGSQVKAQDLRPA
jgi:hypothetical protein